MFWMAGVVVVDRMPWESGEEVLAGFLRSEQVRGKAVVRLVSREVGQDGTDGGGGQCDAVLVPGVWTVPDDDCGGIRESIGPRRTCGRTHGLECSCRRGQGAEHGAVRWMWPELLGEAGNDWIVASWINVPNGVWVYGTVEVDNVVEVGGRAWPVAHVTRVVVDGGGAVRAELRGEAVAHGAECGVKPGRREHGWLGGVCEWKGQAMLSEEWTQPCGGDFEGI